MTHLEILKKARKILNRRTTAFITGSKYICVAIHLAAGQNNYDKAANLTKWVMEMLGGEPSLRTWLINNGCPDCTTGQVNAHRILWIDKLISEYENE